MKSFWGDCWGRLPVSSDRLKRLTFAMIPPCRTGAKWFFLIYFIDFIICFFIL